MRLEALLAVLDRGNYRRQTVAARLSTRGGNDSRGALSFGVASRGRYASNVEPRRLGGPVGSQSRDGRREAFRKVSGRDRRDPRMVPARAASRVSRRHATLRDGSGACNVRAPADPTLNELPSSD